MSGYSRDQETHAGLDSRVRGRGQSRPGIEPPWFDCPADPTRAGRDFLEVCA